MAKGNRTPSTTTTLVALFPLFLWAVVEKDWLAAEAAAEEDDGSNEAARDAVPTEQRSKREVVNIMELSLCLDCNLIR
jgi:hypothetical protein